MISNFSTSMICVNLHLGQKRGKFLNTDLPPFNGPEAMLVNSEFRQRSGLRFEGRAAARRDSNAA